MRSSRYWWGRLFVTGILVFAYLLSLVSNRSIFGLGVWSFSGFSALFPILLAGLFWKRSTKQGAFACVLSVIVMWLYFFGQSGNARDYTIADTGIMPVAVLLAVSTATLIVVSLATSPPDRVTLEKFFGNSQ